MTVTHVERFSPVTTTATTFEISSYNLNPGLAAMFPWLCDVANRYEKYKFRNVSFRYISNSPAVAGTVTLAFDFDPNDDAPSTMDEATTYHDYISASVWAQNVRLNIDLANGDRLPQKDTRPGLPGSDIDLNVYDVGRLHVMTQGAAASTIGYLEIAYTVDLFIHQVQSGVGGLGTSTTGLDATHLVGTDFTADDQAFLPVTATGTNTLTFHQPFEGITLIVITGVDIQAINSITGTATYDQLESSLVGAATEMTVAYRIRAINGQTLAFGLAGATSISSVRWYFARAGYNSLE